MSGVAVCLFLHVCSPTVTVIGEKQRPGFNPRLAHVGYTTEQVVLGHMYLREFPLSSKNYIILPMNHARLSFKTGTVSPFELAVPPGACIIHISHGSFLTWMHRERQTFSYARHADIWGNGGILPLILNFGH